MIIATKFPYAFTWLKNRTWVKMRWFMNTPKIVVIGGGTGTFELLSGLKKYTPNLTALVSMADDGGSTGLLRDEYGVLPPGDVRKALVALARAPEMRQLFNYRYEDGSFAGHSFGNLFLSTVEKMTDNFIDAVALASKVLNITGRVLPVTLDNITLIIEEQDGRIIRGEHKLDGKLMFASPRPAVRLEPTARLTPEGRAAILEADTVVIAPGSLYGSLAAVLVVDGVAEALEQTAAKKIYICNLVTEHGQTDGFKVHDFAGEIERFLGGKPLLNYVLYNSRKPSPKLLGHYYEQEQRTWVEHDADELARQYYVAIGGDFLSEASMRDASLIRHHAGKIAQAILRLR